MTSATVSGIRPGSSGGSSSGLVGAGGRVEVASRIAAAVIAQIASAVMVRTRWRIRAVWSRTWLWSRPNWSLPTWKSSLFHGPAHARDRDQGAQRDPAALGNVAVEVGLIGGVFEVSADEQVVPRAGGGDPGPRVAPVSFRPWPHEARFQAVVGTSLRAWSARALRQALSATVNGQGTPST